MCLNTWCESFGSVSERQEESYTCSHPVVVILVAGQLNHQTVVGGVTSGRQSTRSRQHLVDRAVVNASSWCNSVTFGHEPDKWHFSVELLGLRIVQNVGRAVPSSTLHEQSMTVDTIIWLFGDLSESVLIDDLEVELELVDGDNVLTGVVLQGCREEGLREEESGNPESNRGA